MKTKSLSLLAGAVAFIFTATPSIVEAQLGQAQSGQNQIYQKFAGVELTEAQRTRLREIRRDARSEIEAVLTPEQRRQLQSSREGSERQPSALTNMNLSQTQRSQIQSILRSAKNRTDAILTPEQRQQVRSNTEQQRQQRQEEQIFR